MTAWISATRERSFWGLFCWKWWWLGYGKWSAIWSAVPVWWWSYAQQKILITRNWHKYYKYAHPSTTAATLQPPTAPLNQQKVHFFLQYVITSETVYMYL